MGALTKTITNRIGIYGPSDVNSWGGARKWGAFTWAINADMGVRVGKYIASPFSLNSSVAKDLIHKLFESLALDSDANGSLSLLLSTSSFTLTSGLSDLILTDANGYRYNFPDRADDADDRDETSWTNAAGESTTWATPTTPTTTWS